MTVGVGSLI